jgi:hypothetical protein
MFTHPASSSVIPKADSLESRRDSRDSRTQPRLCVLQPHRLGGSRRTHADVRALPALNQLSLARRR